MGLESGKPGPEQKFEIIRNIAEDPLAEAPQENSEDEGSLQLDTTIDFANMTSKDVGKEVGTFVDRMLEDDDMLGVIAMKPKERADALKRISGNPELVSMADALVGQVKAGRKDGQKAMKEIGEAFARIRDKEKAKAVRNKIAGKG
jgi:hypothetical protein